MYTTGTVGNLGTLNIAFVPGRNINVNWKFKATFYNLHFCFDETAAFVLKCMIQYASEYTARRLHVRNIISEITLAAFMPQYESFFNFIKLELNLKKKN